MKYVVDPLNADLAILTTDNYSNKSILFEKAKYKWIIENPEDFREYYKENFSGSWEEYFLKGKNTGLLESGLIHFAFKDIVLKKYIDILNSYNFIIYSRFDQYYVDYHPELEIDNEEILIPQGEDYFGICDRHAAFNSLLSNDFFKICEFVNSNATDNYSSNFLNCEVTFKNQLHNFNLHKRIFRYKRFQFTTAVSGDKTNWRVPKYKIFLTKSLYIKYPDEFLDSISNLIKKYGFVISFFKHPVFVLYFLYLNTRKISGKIIRFFGINK